jgi:uncharacterized membrane protein
MTEPRFDYSAAPNDVIDVAARERSLRRLTHMLYGLYALFWLTGGISAIVAVIINYVKREDTVGTLYESHFRWQIRTFWWALIWAALGGLLMMVVVGAVVLWATLIWVLYRIIKGWMFLNDGKPMRPRVAVAV